jgi:hypothetical protein
VVPLEVDVSSGGRQATSDSVKRKARVLTQGAYGTSPRSWRSSPLVCALPLLL